MAQYSCRIYSNTGFNAINLPDSPALLNNMAFFDAPVLDLNQERFLPSVRVRASWDSVKNADYCKVGDFFYCITSVSMTSGDTAQLNLTPDFITSAGGFAALDILDGATNRVHVSDDSYGLYGSDDPYMAPAYDMDVMSDTSTGDFSADKVYTFIETTLDLAELGMQKVRGDQTAITAVDASNEDYYVTYPTVPSFNGRVNYYAQIGNLQKGLISPDGLGLYLVGRDPHTEPNPMTIVNYGIMMARAMGVEQSISGHYSIPQSFIYFDQDTLHPGVVLSGVRGACGVRHLSTLPFKYGNAKNNRIFYGSYTPYYLCSAAGNIMQCNAEEIYSGNPGPSVVWTADPRRTGKPYFRFDPLNSISCLSPSDKGMDFFRKCVAGKEWLSNPMVLTGKSGSLIDTINFNSSQQMQNLALSQAAENKFMGDIYRVGDAIVADASLMGVAENIGIMGLGKGVWEQAKRSETEDREYQHMRQTANLAKARELQQFQISQNVTMPTVMFGGTPDLLAEATGNGFIAYRTVYKPADIARIDKILTAFGYKHVKQLETSDFFNRQYFNYVEGGISVGSLPRWWADGVSQQISGGVRVWHVKPNASHYNNNPIA